MTIGDNRDYIRVLLYSYYTTITGWGVSIHNRFVHIELSEFQKGLQLSTEDVNAQVSDRLERPAAGCRLPNRPNPKAVNSKP